MAKRKKEKKSDRQSINTVAFQAVMGAAALAIISPVLQSQAKSPNTKDLFNDNVTPISGRIYSESESISTNYSINFGGPDKWKSILSYLENDIHNEQILVTVYSTKDGSLAMRVGGQLSDEVLLPSAIFDSKGDVYVPKSYEETRFSEDYLMIKPNWKDAPEPISIEVQDGNDMFNPGYYYRMPQTNIHEYTFNVQKPEILRRNYRRLAIINAASEFGRSLPESHKFLGEKIAESMKTFDETKVDSDERVRKLILFVNQTANDLEQVADNEVGENSRAALLGFKLLALTVEESAESENVYPPTSPWSLEDLSKILGTLVTLFKAIEWLYLKVKGIRSRNNAPEKSESSVDVAEQVKIPEASFRIFDPKIFDALRERIRKLILEYSRQIEDISDPSKNLEVIHNEYSIRICKDLVAIQDMFSGILPSEFGGAWNSFGCRSPIVFPTHQL